MKKNYKIIILILLIIVLIVVLILQKKGYLVLKTEPSNQTAFSGLLKGFSLSAKSSSAEDFTAFFRKAQEAGQIVSWAGDWQELANLEKGGPTVVASLGAKFGYLPVIQAQFFSQNKGELLRPLDDANKKTYLEAAANFAEKFKPPYLALGIEINVLAEKSPADFDNFVAFYNEVYQAVKAKSPGTQVFSTFQLEKMKGLAGGLFGGSNDSNKNQWSLLDKFSNLDLVAFTTYPDLIYQNPTDLPSDYYQGIKSYTTKPLAFTEIGWHSAASPSGWESSEVEQAEFVEKFFNQTKELNIELAIWSFLFDQNVIEPFNSMGLIDKENKAKSAWSKWLEAQY